MVIKILKSEKFEIFSTENFLNFNVIDFLGRFRLSHLFYYYIEVDVKRTIYFHLFPHNKCFFFITLLNFEVNHERNKSMERTIFDLFYYFVVSDNRIINILLILSILLEEL